MLITDQNEKLVGEAEEGTGLALGRAVPKSVHMAAAPSTPEMLWKPDVEEQKQGGERGTGMCS